MKLIKFLFFIGLILGGWYVWHHHLKTPHSDVEVSETGFRRVAWIQNANPHEVVIMAPT